ncbi:MAG TPA: outer membrane lipoprotein carrier protein LolA [Acidobacteriaceae bacterium]|nr:outer membrane lipoprotein carrier protein LolA [Acidobacteriaceae bacterium]
MIIETAKKIALCLGLMMVLPASLNAQAGGDVQSVIEQLNSAAAKFQSAQADFTWDLFQAVVQEHDLQTGTIYYERNKGGMRVAAYIKQENGKDAPKTVTFDGKQAQYYVPAIKQDTLINAGSNRSQWESFLTLGFGGSGTELQANWKVSLQGTETMDGTLVDKLDLVPIQTNVADMFSHVTIWIDPARGISLKQIFYQPSGDTRTAVYKNIRYNVPLPHSVFELKLPKDVTRVVK